MIKTDYQQQAQDFLNKTNTQFKAEFLKHDKHFPEDKESRDIYKITLSRGSRAYSFNFGQSINASGSRWLYGKAENGIAKAVNINTLQILYIHPSWTEKGVGKIGDKIPSYSKDWDKNPNFSSPSAYDVLACLTKYDPGTFENFCSDFGYDEDSRKTEKIYKAVCDEYINLKVLFSDEELEQMQEIQ